MRYSIVVICLLALMPAASWGGEATQTDWSGGQGILGPVSAWGNQYHNGKGIFNSDPSQITLSADPLIEHVIDGNFSAVCAVYAVDVNGDGDIDVLGAGKGANAIVWWENSGTAGGKWTKHIVGSDFTGARSVFAIDIDGDGDMDVLGAAYSDDDITWWENSDGAGTSWVEHTIDGAFGGACSVYAADIDGDDDYDVIGAAEKDGDIVWWENTDGTGTAWAKNSIDAAFNGARAVYTIDIDDDGDVDVLGAAFADDDITWWENKGLGTVWTEHTVDRNFNGACAVHAVDVDGDNDIDVLGAAFYDEDITWWENTNGYGTAWKEHTVDASLGGACAVHGSDLDNDGDVDIIGAGSAANEIAGWENTNGSGTEWILHCVDDSYNGANAVYAADIDGDGNVDDVVGSAVYGNDVSWWEWEKDVNFSDGQLISSILNIVTSSYWNSIGWTATTTSATSVAFQVRASDDASNMGAWSDTLKAPGSLASVITGSATYFQYKVIMHTTDRHFTPILKDVTVRWHEPTATDESAAGQRPVMSLYGAKTNPAENQASIVFSLTGDAGLEFSVYDTSGRTVYAVSGEYQPGTHEIHLEDLSCGVYMVRMSSDNFTETSHFVIVE